MAVEGLVLDGLDLQAGVYSVTAMQFTPARKRPEWAEAVDGDGALLIRDPYSENSQWAATVEVRSASRDAGHTAAGLITDKLEEAERQPLGLPLVWTPADSTKALTFYVLTGEVTEVPITHESGYFASPPVIALSVVLTCRPFGYGAEVTVASAGGAGPLQIFTVSGVTGDVPAEARLIVTDTATQSRKYVAWGLEQRYQAGADLTLTQPDLTATGFIGTSTTRAGSVSTNIYRGTLTTDALAVCGTGNQPHIGVFRLMGRVWASSTTVRVRVTYRAGDGPLKSLLWETPAAEDAWCEVDLGVVTIPPKTLGTQRWQAQIEAYAGVAGETLDVDYLLLIPAGEGYAKASVGTSLAAPTQIVHRDEFDQTAGAMTGKTAPIGGVYTGAGDADDFSATGSGTATRTAISDADVNTGRYLISGMANQTGVVAQVDWKRSGSMVGGTSAGIMHNGLLVRYVDVNNWLKLVLVRTRANAGVPGVGAYTLELIKRVAGTVTPLKSYLFGDLLWGVSPVDVLYRFKLMVLPSGSYYAWFGYPTSLTQFWTGSDSALATGGALATGKVGAYDAFTDSATGTTRTIDNLVASPMPEDFVIFSGRSIEFRSDATFRYDSTGTYEGELSPRGAPFFIPPAGDENRTSRVAVMARRVNIDEAAEANVTDNQSVEVRYTPRYLYLPR